MDLEELLTGLTDIPICLCAVILGIITGERAKSGWSRLFFIIAAGIRAVLYPLLFEAVRRFSLLMTDYIQKTESKEHTAVFLIEAGLYLITEILYFALPIHEIFVFIVLAILCTIRIAACIVRSKRFPAKLIWLWCFSLFRYCCRCRKNSFRLPLLPNISSGSVPS